MNDKIIEVFGIPTIQYQDGVWPIPRDFADDTQHYMTIKPIWKDWGPVYYTPWHRRIGNPNIEKYSWEKHSRYSKEVNMPSHLNGMYNYIRCNEWGKYPQMQEFYVEAQDKSGALQKLKEYVIGLMQGKQADYLSCYSYPTVLDFSSDDKKVASFICGMIKSDRRLEETYLRF